MTVSKNQSKKRRGRNEREHKPSDATHPRLIGTRVIGISGHVVHIHQELGNSRAALVAHRAEGFPTHIDFIAPAAAGNYSVRL